MYIKSIEQDVVPFEIEALTEAQQLNEYIMTSLRTIEGLSMSVIQQKWGKEKADSIQKATKKYVDQQMIFLKDDKLILTQKGKLFADGIAAALFF